MTKAELVSKFSLNTGVEKLTTLAIVESMMSEIKDSIAENESVFLRGFGTLFKDFNTRTSLNAID